MPNTLPLKLNNKSLLIILAIIISWIPIYSVAFLNDDYQIIVFYSNKSFFELFKVFWERGVYYYYWRPIPDFIHGLTLFTAGFQPLAFRIVGIIIYCIASVQIFRVFRFLGLQEKTAFISAVFFGVLPSHVLEAAWIADQLESLAACFLLLSFINYLKANPPNPVQDDKPAIKYLILSGLWFIAALLTKEVAYTGIFIPFIALIYNNNLIRKSIIRTAEHVFAGMLILITVLSYRILFIGGTPFEASHFSKITILGMIKNLLVYFPLAFSPPEILESVYNFSNMWLYLLLTMVLLILLILSARGYKSLSNSRKNIFFTGIAWYVIFIIPALPTLMRWYVFTASIGLILMLAVLVENLSKNKIFLTVFTAVIIFSGFYDFSTMLDWREAGIKMENGLNSIKNLRSTISSDTLYIWGVPDKFKRVPMMKLGIQQSVEWAIGNPGRKKIQVFSPLRSELLDAQSEIILTEASDSTFKFVLYNGRFLPEGGTSTSIIQKEELYFANHQLEIKIKTTPRNHAVPISEAEVKFLQKSNADHLFYTGKKFVLLIKKDD